MDGDFHATWHTPAAYNGPAFTAGSGIFGYGAIGLGPIITDIWRNRDGNAEPPSGQRFTAYFRTTVTPTNPVNRLLLQGVLDDGCIIYANGAEITRINVTPSGDAADWQTTAVAEGNENRIISHEVAGLSFPAGQPLDLALSLHNRAPTSSDLGFNLRVLSLD